MWEHREFSSFSATTHSIGILYPASPMRGEEKNLPETSAAYTGGMPPAAMFFFLCSLAGWFLLAKSHTSLSLQSTRERSPVTVIIPARNEAGTLPPLLLSLMPQKQSGDRILVCDDGSVDGTGLVAKAYGAEVLHPSPPEEGWLGKPNACWQAVEQTGGERDNDVLLFLDADVRLADDTLMRIVAEVEQYPTSIVSIQPLHHPGTLVENTSAFFNIVTLMGVGHFNAASSRLPAAEAAFGPVLAMTRREYLKIGGHAHPQVRGKHTEDIALARLAQHVRLHAGVPDVHFRMYPGGWKEMSHGWIRTIATGTSVTPWWAMLLTFAWISGLLLACQPNPISFLLYPLAVMEVWWACRRAGQFSILVPLLFPIALTLFFFLTTISMWKYVTGQTVSWKGRSVPSR